MTKEEITAAITEYVAAEDVEAIEALITFQNALTLKSYVESRQGRIDMYDSLRSSFPELAEKTDAEMDVIFATPITGDELHAILNPE